LDEGNPMEKHFTAEQLKAWRERHGWTQAEAANHILLSLDGYRKKEWLIVAFGEGGGAGCSRAVS
jgi:hypothetical protein